jgi:hypothetical protein
MAYLEVLKRTARSLAFFLIIALFTINYSFAEDLKDSCRQINGKFYIVNEYIKQCGYLNFNCNTLDQIQGYETVASCNSAAIEKYGCIPALEDRVFYGSATNNYRVNYATNTISLGEAKACLTNLAQNPNSNTNLLGTSTSCNSGTKFFQCKCTKTLLGEAGNFGEVVSWVTGSETYNCYMKQLLPAQLRSLQEVKPLSPLAFFKATADALFYIAVLIFIFNILRAGLLYTRSGGTPDELKKARFVLYQTISGMIFFILVSGLIFYTNNAFGVK